MNIQINPLQQNDVVEATRIFRVAFAKQMGIPDPDLFHPGSTLNAPLHIDPEGNFGAFVDDRLVGCIFSAVWGTAGYFGPLVVLPEYWGLGLGQKLLAPVIAHFDRCKTTVQGLYTFASSPKHIGLYQKFGFYPRALTALTSKVINAAAPTIEGIVTYSSLNAPAREACLSELRSLTGDLYEGLDLTREILTLEKLAVGETVLLMRDKKPVAFAVCAYGADSEAETGAGYIKFAAARRGDSAVDDFAAIVCGVENHLAGCGLLKMEAGVNTARQSAYESLLSLGFKPFTYGVLMLKPNKPAYDRPDCLVIDDWR